MILSKLATRSLWHRHVGIFSNTCIVPGRTLFSSLHGPRCVIINRRNKDEQEKSVWMVSRRSFRPPNSFYGAKRKPLAEAMELVVSGIICLGLAYILLNVTFLWSIIPQFIRYPFEKMADLVVKLLKKADSYNKDEQSIEASEESILKSILHHFSINRDQQGRVGGFRDRKIIEYENRIRLYSNPDKIFRYFASIKITYANGESEIYMTPDDFLRALTPGVKQPDGLGLDQYKKVDLSRNNIIGGEPFEMSTMLSQISGSDEFKYPLKADSIFYKLSQSGLINFTDFLFLLTVISVSKRHFEIAFRMFDLNGDGNVEYNEFEKVQSAILTQTSIGKKMGSNAHYKGISSALSKYFFGDHLSHKLTITDFLNFQNDLQTELLTLEFERKTPDKQTGRISEMDFAELLVAYAVLNEKKRNRMLKRVEEKFVNQDNWGITLQDYLDFFKFLQNINDVDIALTFHNMAGASIDQATLKHVASTVAHVQLSDHLVEVVFTLFDENDDGQLSNKEFVSVLKERLRRGLSKPKDTGLFKILQTIGKSIVTFNL